MNDSFQSAEANNQKAKTILYNEIHTLNTNNWQADDIDFSLDKSQNQSAHEERSNLSFDTDLPVQSKIEEPILSVQQILEVQQNDTTPQKSILEAKSQPQIKAQPEKVETNNSLPQQQPQTKPQSQPQPAEKCEQINSSLPSQVTITLYEQSISSKVYDQFDTEDASGFSTSLKSFLSLNDKNYRPHVKCIKFLFNKLKDFSKRSLQNLKIYINFMEVKMRQEIQSLRHLDSLESISHDDPDFQDLNLDEKVILGKMKQTNMARRQQRKLFYKTIKEQYKRLLECWRKIKQRRQKRQRHIDEQIVRILDRIELQMQDMIICRLNSEKQKSESKFSPQKVRSKNPYLQKDKYLEMKYLIQRQKAYLKLITDFNGKVITYMVTMFSKQQPQIVKTIKQALLNYSTSYMDCYDHQNQILTIKMDNLEEFKCEEKIKLELADVLLTMIPLQLYNIRQRKKEIRNAEKNKLEAILSDFSDSLQNTIFLSTIEMNYQFILFRSEATWRTSSSILDNEQSSLMYQTKNDTKFESKQILAQSRPSMDGNDQTLKRRNIKLVVVLTSNYYIHLEHEDKIATLKLGEVKLSKRGRQIIICNKEKGIGGYFGMKRQLGILEFEGTGEVQEFAHKLSRALSKICP